VWTQAIGVSTIDQTIIGGPPPHLLDYPILRAHSRAGAAAIKAEWAEKKLAELRQSWDSQTADDDSCPLLEATLDPTTGYHSFRVGTLPKPERREEISLIAGDVIHNLRSALDHLAWAMASEFSGGEPPDPTGVQFPIRDTAAAFGEARRVRAQLAVAHWQFIESVQPYHGVDGRSDSWHGPYNHQLALLRDLSNDDKHRLTRVTLLMPSQVWFPNFRIAKIANTVPGFGEFTRSDFEFVAAGQSIALGLEVIRLRLVDATDQISPAGILRPRLAMADGKPLVETLERLGLFVRLVLTEFVRQFP
jgi:hypothetical protein